MARRPLKKHQRALLFASGLSVVAWVLGPVAWLLLPLQYLNTHFHELFHAIMAHASGGYAAYIAVYANASGVTPVAGGNGLLVASAGYVGAAILGAAIVVWARTPELAQGTLKALAIALAISCIVWVRGDFVGLVAGWGWVGLLWLLGAKLKGDQVLFAAQLIGLQQCLNAVQSLFVVYGLSAYGHTQNDAGILAEMTGIPAVVWAGLWTVFSLALIVFALRKAWVEPAR